MSRHSENTENNGYDPFRDPNWHNGPNGPIPVPPPAVCESVIRLNNQTFSLPKRPDVMPPRATTQAFFQQQFPATSSEAPNPSYKKQASAPTFPSIPTEFSEDFPPPAIHLVPR